MLETLIFLLVGLSIFALILIGLLIYLWRSGEAAPAGYSATQTRSGSPTRTRSGRGGGGGCPNCGGSGRLVVPGNSGLTQISCPICRR